VPTVVRSGCLAAGVCEDFIQISRPIPEVLHLYLPNDAFTDHAVGLRFSDVRLRYCTGFRDPLIEQIAHVMLAELMESLANTPAARLLHTYSSLSTKTLRTSGLQRETRQCSDARWHHGPGQAGASAVDCPCGRFGHQPGGTVKSEQVPQLNEALHQD
jgi:hypothetical protein